ncbi:phosphotransferase [Chelativorans sp. ZYF759]|uniref:phosphotransferase n=1 Tax=Chelativorans sp. ZYF759 TaxID=2692213 RepID=UPI00145DCF46|nr:phosphotransferase [Chelativorans sp. ZYF759]NMG41374.1 phosphotransferase [Chelativorans sp. ZYF759]
MSEFVTRLVLKRDLFSETRKGHLASAPDRPMIRRDVSAAPAWSRPLGWLLARREIATMRALDGVPGTPHLVSVDADGLLRTWTEGAPLHLARPADRAWYADAFRLLRALRRAGITHNDLAKPQNWLMTPDGRAAIIDFQLASRHRRRGPFYRLLAYEDFRHLLKQMRAFAPELMTPTAKRILKRRSLPSRIWMATGKRLYNLVTRGIFRWSDGEGTHDRLDAEGPAIRAAFLAEGGVSDVAITTYPLPRKGVGLYAFVETGSPLPPVETSADIVQPVPALPRDAQGRARLDLLDRVAMNQTPELPALIGDDPALAAIMEPIVAGRRNFTDRRISRLEG